MKRNLPCNTQNLLRSGVQISRIAQIIAERWPEIWQASVDRQEQYLEHHHNLLISARQQLQKDLV
jgi:hypothetical protein